MRSVALLPLCGLCLGILLATPSDAWAYVDPGTGSYLFQLAIAGFLAAAYTLRTQWHALKTMIRGRIGRGRASGDVADGR
jgi:hypothetical protein